MISQAYLSCLIAVCVLWTLWIVALGLERRWFRNAWRDWRAMPLSAKAAAIVLCAYCTVTAQKPGNASSNAPAASLPGNARQAGGSAAPPPPPPPSPPPPPDGPRGVRSGPSRIVLQATPASDPGVAAAFSGEPGWSLPAAVPATPKLNALSFAGNVTNPVSPVCFPNAAEVTVQTLMLVTRGDAADLATLADAPEPARLRLVSDGSRQTEPNAAELALTRQFVPQRWQVVAVDFGSPASLPEIFFGGTAGRPVWDRGWRGEIAEIVGFDTPPDADVRAGVANYLSIRWGLAPRHPASPAQRQAAIDAGLAYGLVWGSVLLLR